MTIEPEFQSVVGSLQDDVYQEIRGPEFDDGISATLVISSIDPEYKGRVKAEMQLIDSAGFTVYYSEPAIRLTGKWVGMVGGEKYTLDVVIRNQ